MPSYYTREQVYTALFGLVTPLLAPGAVDGPPDGEPASTGVSAAAGVPTSDQPFNLISREIIEVSRIPPALQPALLMYEMDEQYINSGDGLTKGVWTVVFIFAACSQRGTPGQTILNPLIDRVLTVLEPPEGEPLNTLGGMCYQVLANGTAGKDHGDNSTNSDYRQASYYLPVQIIEPFVLP